MSFAGSHRPCLSALSMMIGEWMGSEDGFGPGTSARVHLRP